MPGSQTSWLSATRRRESGAKIAGVSLLISRTLRRWLSTTLGDAEEALVQVLPPLEEFTRSWYPLSHPDLRKTLRIAAFVDHGRGDILALRRVLIG